MPIKIEAFLNPWMPAGGSRVDAVLSVSAPGAEEDAAPVRRVVGLALDVSPSMATPRKAPKIDAMRPAAQIAVEQLQDGDEFFVVAFSARAWTLVPLTRATKEAKRAACALIARLSVDNGTCISSALNAARTEALKAPGAVCQLLLMTDGENNPDDAAGLAAAVRACEGVFQAHCRRFGAPDGAADGDEARMRDQSIAELKNISQRLLGTVSMIAGAEGLAKDFRDTFEKARAKSAADVRLRLRMPGSCSLRSLKQGYPVEIDITPRRVQVDQWTAEFPLGDLGREPQDYCATFDVAPLAVGEQMRAARAGVWRRDPATGQMAEAAVASVTVQWTDDVGATARIDPQVAHYTGQGEKARAIEEGLQALSAGDIATATVRLGRAAQLAAISGDDETTKRLAKVVDVVDAEQGTVTVRRNLARADLMGLDAGATSTVRVGKRSGQG